MVQYQNPDIIQAACQKYCKQKNPVTQEIFELANSSLSRNEYSSVFPMLFNLYCEQGGSINEWLLRKARETQDRDIIRNMFQKYCEQKNPITETVLQEAMEAKDIEVIIACVAKYFLEQLSTHQEDNNDALLSDLRKMQEDPSIEKLIESLNRLKEAQSYTELEIKFFKLVGKNNLLDNADLMMQVAFNILKQCSDKDIYEMALDQHLF